ncbi:MAG: cyclic nucleotide-binding domain-containing protein [Nitrospirae bacterium]|nr:cyclic nucleotide-binding domain-containing protein [Nitrospirota bacterium]
MANVLVDNLKPGMMLNTDVTDSSGRLLIRGGTVISEANIRMFKTRDIEAVKIEGVEQEASETPEKSDATESGPSGQRPPAVSANVPVDNLKPGMKLKSDVADGTGRLLIRGGTVISEANIRMFKTRDIEVVEIEGVEQDEAPEKSDATELGHVVQPETPVAKKPAIATPDRSQQRPVTSTAAVAVDNLIPGMTLKNDVSDSAGRLIMRKGTVMSEVTIRVLKMRHVEAVHRMGDDEEADEIDSNKTVHAVRSDVSGASDPAVAAPQAEAHYEVSKEDENKIRIMRATDFFKPFTDDELLMILGNSTWLRCSSGEIVLKEGESSDLSFFVILKGSICIQKRIGGTSMKKTIDRLKRGECFGEMSIIRRQQRSADVVAEEEAYVLKIDADTLNKQTDSFDLMSIQLKFYKAFSEILAERLAHSAARACKLS